MAELNELDCKVYVEAGATLDELSALAGNGSSASGDLVGNARTIQVPSGEIEIRRNPDSQAALVGDFPDGFLFFRYVLEFYPRARTERAERIALITSLLGSLWGRGWAAVASCDYEDELPYEGGYRQTSLPWPAKGGRSEGNLVVNPSSRPGTLSQEREPAGEQHDTAPTKST